MKRTLLHHLLLLAAFPALLVNASCSDDNPAGTNSGTPNEDIHFKITFAPPSTRVATDTKYNTTWEDGDAIGIFAVEHGTTLAAANNLIHNVKLTYSSANGGIWTTVEPLYWPMDGKKLDFYAYYPYDQARTNPLSIAFSVPKDQSAATTAGPAYNRHDLLMAKAGDKGTGFGKGETVPLDFFHALAMVEMNVSKSMVGDYAPDALIVRLNGCTTASVLDLSTQSTAQPSGPTPAEILKMYPCPNDGAPGIFAYRALVPAQTIAVGTVLFSFEYNGSTLFRSQPLAQELTLAVGRAETFGMTFPFTSVTVSDTKRLADLLTGDELATVTRLKVLGEMTAADFFTIRDGMPSIVSLDLGDATVEGNTIPNDALEKKKGLQEFIFPQGITAIGSYAFWNCNDLTGSLTIPEGVTTIGHHAFYGCTGFTGSLVLPTSVTTIGYSAFSGCSGFTGSLTIPKNVTTIEQDIFWECSGFNSLTISDGITEIGPRAFENCSGLNSLTIPASVTTIDRYAFHTCTSLSSITCHIPDPTKVTFGHAVFENIPRTIPVYVPSAAVNDYKNHSVWWSFNNIQPIPQP